MHLPSNQSYFTPPQAKKLFTNGCWRAAKMKLKDFFSKNNKNQSQLREIITQLNDLKDDELYHLNYVLDKEIERRGEPQ